jgi:hypothetical protein
MPDENEPLATLKAIAENGSEKAAPHTIEAACAWAVKEIKELRSQTLEPPCANLNCEDGNGKTHIAGMALGKPVEVRVCEECATNA